MNPRFSWRWAAAFGLLVLVLHEAHELAHTWTGRLLCSGWGTRDFNTWSLAEGCDTWVPAAMGPLFSYAVLWIGAGLLTNGTRRSKHLGLALLFAANPFARILTVALGGGDELIVASRISGVANVALWLATLAVVLLVCVPPLVVGGRALRGTRRRGLWFAGLLFGPLVLVIVVLLLGLNGLLQAGLLATPALWGEPPLVLLTTVITVVSLALTARWLVQPPRARSA